MFLRVPPEPPGAGRDRRDPFSAPSATSGCWMRISRRASTRSTTPRSWTGYGRIGDKRVLALVKAFLKAGIMTEDGAQRRPDRNTARWDPVPAAGQHRPVGAG